MHTPGVSSGGTMVTCPLLPLFFSQVQVEYHRSYVKAIETEYWVTLYQKPEPYAQAGCPA